MWSQNQSGHARDAAADLLDHEITLITTMYRANADGPESVHDAQALAFGPRAIHGRRGDRHRQIQTPT